MTNTQQILRKLNSDIFKQFRKEWLFAIIRFGKGAHHALRGIFLLLAVIALHIAVLAEWFITELVDKKSKGRRNVLACSTARRSSAAQLIPRIQLAEEYGREGQ